MEVFPLIFVQFMHCVDIGYMVRKVIKRYEEGYDKGGMGGVMGYVGRGELMEGIVREVSWLRERGRVMGRVWRDGIVAGGGGSSEGRDMVEEEVKWRSVGLARMLIEMSRGGRLIFLGVSGDGKRIVGERMGLVVECLGVRELSGISKELIGSRVKEVKMGNSEIMSSSLVEKVEVKELGGKLVEFVGDDIDIGIMGEINALDREVFDWEVRNGKRRVDNG